MKHFIFTVYDQKADAHLPPFIMHKEGMAERVFADCVNNPEHNFGRHPEDYTLFQIGEFDDVKGVVTPLVSNRSLGNGRTFMGPVPDAELFQLEEVKHG